MAKISSIPGSDRKQRPLPRRSSEGSAPIRWILSLVIAAGLAVDAYIHWLLAPRFDTLVGVASPHISQGQLFRVEAAAAAVAMLLVLFTRNRLGALVALLIAAGGLAVLLLYAFVDVGGFGPMPDMYDPTWYTEKAVCALAEALAAIAALWLLLMPARRPGRAD